MIIRYASDLHLDHSSRSKRKNILPRLEEDISSMLILAGDIGNGLTGTVFVKAMCERFRYVVMVMGNHEYYNKDFNTAVRKYKKSMRAHSNFYLLDNEGAFIEGIKFLGGTLWTDFNGCKHSMGIAQRAMNDYHVITNALGRSYHDKLTPSDTVQAHNKTLYFFDQELSKITSGKTVVITHHLPHLSCVPLKYLGSDLNPAFVSNLDLFIRKHRIDYWIHGHAHSNVNVTVNGTKILCNPRGYEDIKNDFNLDFDNRAHLNIEENDKG